jgi:hypothetical protein
MLTIRLLAPPPWTIWTFGSKLDQIETAAGREIDRVAVDEATEDFFLAPARSTRISEAATPRHKGVHPTNGAIVASATQWTPMHTSLRTNGSKHGEWARLRNRASFPQRAAGRPAVDARCRRHRSDAQPLH